MVTTVLDAYRVAGVTSVMPGTEVGLTTGRCWTCRTRA